MPGSTGTPSCGPVSTASPWFDQINWIGAWDATTHEYVREWVPSLDVQFNEGAWALFVDSDDCMWFGGDFSRGSFVGSTPQYLRGFGKYCPRDIVGAVDTDQPGRRLRCRGRHRPLVGCVDRRGRSFPRLRGAAQRPGDSGSRCSARATPTPAASPGDRYFVRAIDSTGNRSATTAVVLPSDVSSPSTPTNLVATVLAGNDVQLDWGASTDNVGVTGYAVFRNGVELTQVAGDFDGVGWSAVGEQLSAGSGVGCGGEPVVQDAAGVGDVGGPGHGESVDADESGGDGVGR